jgi:hypothetical protein
LISEKSKEFVPKSTSNWPKSENIGFFENKKLESFCEFRFYEPPMNSSVKKKRGVKIKILSPILNQLV